MIKYVGKNYHKSTTSYSAVDVFVRHSKPFQEVMFLNEVWLACAFDDFDNNENNSVHQRYWLLYLETHKGKI